MKRGSEKREVFEDVPGQNIASTTIFCHDETYSVDIFRSGEPHGMCSRKAGVTCIGSVARIMSVRVCSVWGEGGPMTVVSKIGRLDISP